MEMHCLLMLLILAPTRNFVVQFSKFGRLAQLLLVFAVVNKIYYVIVICTRLHSACHKMC